ncbi:integrase, catalytic region, zinc finger, CCHC-type containing protein [Tanacetum coccineum]
MRTNTLHQVWLTVAQITLYDGNEIINPDHDPTNVPSSEEDLELARQKMHEKMNDPVYVEKRIKYIPPNYSKENFLATFTPQTQLTPKQVFWSIDLEKCKAEELKANTPPLPVLPPATVYPPNTPVHLVPRMLPTTSQVNTGLYVITQLFWDFEKTCKKRITPTGITEGERGFEQTKRCYLTEVIPFFNLLKEHFDSVQKSLVTEVTTMKAVFENMEAEVDQNAVDKKCGEIKRRNLLIMNENFIAECLSKDVFYSATDSVLNVSRFSDMHDALTIAQNRIADLESENFNLRNKIQNDDHDSMIKHFSKLEVEHFNLQLKYQNLKEHFGNKKLVTSLDDSSFDSLFVIGQLNEQIQSRGNTIHELKEKISRLTMKNSDADPIFDPKALVSQNKDLTAKLNALHDLNERFRAENAKVKQHYTELYDSIKITRAKTNDQKNSLLTEIENLKTQLKGKMPCVTIDVKTLKVYAFEKHAIDVEPIPPRQRSNRNVHHGYLNSLKDTLDTLREIVKEARSELPSDSNLDYACVYTKRSQELLANASTSCPKAVNKRDKFIATTHVTKKKHVTFADPLETSGNNIPKHIKQQSVQPTNVPILPSTGVNTATIASGSKPKSNTKKDKTLPAKSVPKKKVEDHPRNNKSKLSKKNHVDSCTSVRSTVCDTNSNSLCKTCNECINSDSHDTCVDKSLKFSKPTLVRKIWRVKQAHHAPVDYNIVCSNQLDPNIDWGSNVSNSPFSYVFKYIHAYSSSTSWISRLHFDLMFLVTFGLEVLDCVLPIDVLDCVFPIDVLDCVLVIMSDANINAPEAPVAADFPPTRSDEQILPRDKWVPFWDTIRFDKDKGYSCQLDEQRFYLTKATLRDALQLPSDNSNFIPPPNSNTIISFVNNLGYPNVVRTLSGILWGVVNGAKIDYAERIWEEFTQCIHSFTEDKMNLALHAEGKKKVNPLNTKRVRFRMAIPDTLISKEIRTAAYYFEYMAKVTKYQRYLTRKAVSDDYALAPKPAKGATTKSTRKPKPQSSKTAPKKRKLVEDTTEAPSQAKRSKAGKVLKKRTLSSTPQLVDEFVDEGVPDKEPMHGDEEADIQRAIEESLKEAQGAHRGSLPPVVFRELDIGKIQPLLEVEGKGKEKVEPSGLVESSSLYAELGLTDSGTDSDEEVSPDMNAQGQEEGQGGTNHGDAGVSRTPSSHVVYAGSNLDHMDLRIVEASSQPNTEQMDDEFTSTVYPKNLNKEFSFTDQFLVEKSQEDEPEKTDTKAEVQSMVTIPIHQDTSSVLLMTTPVTDITEPQSDSTTVPASMPTTTATITKTTTTTTVPLPPPQP